MWRIISQALVLTAFVIVVLTTLSFIISRMMLERSVRSQLSSVAAIAENTVENTLHAHRERASLLANNADIRAVAAGTLAKETIIRLLAVLQRDQSALIGMEIYGANAELIAGAGVAVGLPKQAERMPLAEPIVTASGWTLYDVFTPMWNQNGERLGYISLRYDAHSLLTPLLAVAPTLGETAEVILIRNTEEGPQIIHPSTEDNQSYVLLLGELTDKDQSDFVLLRSLKGTEDVARAEDYRGRDALIAYRYLPTLGWGLAMQVERKEALQDVRSLAVAHSAIGTLLLILAGALAAILANQVTHPLRVLTEHVRRLRPGSWNIKRSVHTGDEVEVLDHVVVDMATRLKKIYEDQEEVIEERTSELTHQYALDSAILESIEYGVIRVDDKGIVSGANPAAISMLNEKRETMIGADVAAVVQICGHRGNPLTGMHPVMECLSNHKATRSPVNAHFNIRRGDEALLPVMYAISPLIADGTTFGAIIVFQDITEERRLDYLKSEFISLASHQLRTPLSALRWYVELFAEGKKKMTDEQQGYIDQMQESITRMVALLTSLLRAAHLEDENLEPDIQKVDLTQLVKELDEDSRAQLHESNLTSKVELPQKAVHLETDPTLLRIVLQNLLSNAIKYTLKDSKTSILIALEESATGITLSVTDHGMGIPKAEQMRVFQKFFRAKNVRKNDTDGNGLGLYITRTIVDRLGGEISFTSEENKGTTFTVTFKKGLKSKKVVKK